MNNTPKSTWRNLRYNARNRLISGMFVLAPVGVTLLVMRWVIQWMAGFFQPFIEKLALRLAAALGMSHIPVQAMKVPLTLLSIVGFLAVVYLTGCFAQAMIGRSLIRFTETALMRVPLARTIYSAAKQVMEAITTPTRSALRTVVLVEFPRHGSWSVGFLTGTLSDVQHRNMLKVFIPTTPNPTTGFLVIVPQQDVKITEMTVEEAFKMIISGGILSPEALHGKLSAQRLSESAQP